ncbi:uncharacterized protein SPSC_01726 [Sporisorium scitamineum]|uniref:DUF803 domain membrane protein n=1 Tax=Sporisorium scitamineum TaxID=49012 RepID=A0A0F7S6U4_9BASI|nr:uncharacterized protein SPSC_01726 [Sporisorium scitamineum]CDW96585.1 hypothetical protein [Sporisorium scitamineum]
MDMLSSSRTWIGVVVAVAGNITISLALNCQKLAHTRLQQAQHGHQQTDNDDSAALQHDGAASAADQSQAQQRASTSRESSESSVTTKHNGHDADADPKAQKTNGNGMDTEFLQSKLWWLGLALMTIGEGGNFISYGFAPASLVAPLGAVALLSNVIISPILLGERFRISDIGGILLAIIGAVTVVFSSKQNDVRLDPAQLLQASKRLEFVIYTAISVSAGALLAFVSSTSLGDRWVLVDVGTCAIFGGFTVLSTKGISSLISGGQPIEALKFPITYGLVVVLAVTAVVQITYLNRALQRFDSREVIPTQFVFFTISAIVGSAILYRDFENMDAHRLINFLFGCLTTFAGVFVLTWRNERSEPQDEEEEPGEESLEEAEAEGEETNESEPLLSHSWHAESRGRDSPKPRQRIGFLEPAFEERPSPSNALRVPSATKSSPSRRPRSRTNSPHTATARLSGSWDRSSHFSRSANQPSVLSSSSSALRTPKLSLMGMDRPTGLSSGHYLLLATPPPSVMLNPVAQARGSRGGATYGAVGKGGAILPFPVTTPGGNTGARGSQTASTAQDSTTSASEPTAAETIATPVVGTSTPSKDAEQELTDRLADQAASPSSHSSGSATHS